MGIAERWKGHPPLPEGLEERLPDIVARLRRAGAELIYLFGSAVVADEENVRGPQDLDLAVWGMDGGGHRHARLRRLRDPYG